MFFQRTTKPMGPSSTPRPVSINRAQHFQIRAFISLAVECSIFIFIYYKSATLISGWEEYNTTDQIQSFKWGWKEGLSDVETTPEKGRRNCGPPLRFQGEASHRHRTGSSLRQQHLPSVPRPSWLRFAPPPPSHLLLPTLGHF